MSSPLDPVTGVCNRSALLTELFRETDRVQRLGQSLALLLLAVDDPDHDRSHRAPPVSDILLRAVAERLSRLLRSYDILGRNNDCEFLIILPGCSAHNATLLAERICAEVFADPFPLPRQAVRLTACFGIASSEGRSPVVVLREAEQALQAAQQQGPESIQVFVHGIDATCDPVEFLA
ncbi:MAG TPA: GGDEF domain-containing protein [Terracidiphilus sp.]|jgi:diguanylate cyclase (GGDEF)-like protein|nr:GGDEF domain-containing protein [Terracidiphilus sp.]